MRLFDRKTRRLYYEDMYLARTRATVVKIDENFIELDATVAFPEGGGQEADCGVIQIEGNGFLRFVGAKKLFGRMVFLDDFPNINVEGVIRHIIHPDDVGLMNGIDIGDEVEVRIDIERRAQLSLSHTASHLLYIAVGKIRPDAIPGTVGCHIKTDSARFDFRIQQRFTADELIQIAEVANELVRLNLPVRLFPHSVELDARYWACKEHVIPCGGTHLEATGPVGNLIVRRKSLGAGKERLICEFPEADVHIDKYRF